MATAYKTPGVYVEEISKLPASVAQVETAIPAFIGYTERAKKGGEPITEPLRITSLPEYETYFGGPQSETTVEVTVIGSGADKVIKATASTQQQEYIPKYLMFYSMQMYFANGGGPCYILSAGNYDAAPINSDALKKALNELKKEDEPTLIVFPDAIGLADIPSYYTLMSDALSQCNQLQDRFTIIDVKDGAVEDLRNILTGYLKYGGAYHPYLKTILNYHYLDEDVNVEFQYEDDGALDGFGLEQVDITALSFDPTEAQLVILNELKGKKFATEDEFKIALEDKFTNAEATSMNSDRQNEVVEKASRKGAEGNKKLNEIEEDDNELYFQIKVELNKLTVTLPPSAAMAGVYARVDSDRGVWKAPANVGINSVVGPSKKITGEDQQNLNVDATGGKSINAIRSFTGKGTLVWGARTLAGNDNEWRYVPVRRFFNMVEESVKKATEFVVFEPNDKNTWVRTKAMIENYLTGLWRQGALAGAKPEQAFYVNVGLGETMTALDILEGRMNIEIGMAAVRPAEFIILKFSHKLQES